MDTSTTLPSFIDPTPTDVPVSYTHLNFRVSVMFDCNGCNTTASAAVAWLAHGRNLAGKRAVVRCV